MPVLDFEHFVDDVHQVLEENGMPREDILDVDVTWLEDLWDDDLTPQEAAEEILQYGGDAEPGDVDWAKEWEDFGEVYDDSYPLDV